MRRLVVVLGDQLDSQSRAFDGFDARLDRVWMAEVAAESTHVPSHKARTALFLAAMRHFRDELRARGATDEYRELGQHTARTLGEALGADLGRLRPGCVTMVQAGEHRVATVSAAVASAGLALELAPDEHFFVTPDTFAGWAHADGFFTPPSTLMTSKKSSFPRSRESRIRQLSEKTGFPFSREGRKRAFADYLRVHQPWAFKLSR